MADIFKRAHARFPCDIEVAVFTGPTGGVNIGKGRIVDLSMSGCYLSFKGELKEGGAYRLRCKRPDGFLDMPGRVVREGRRDPKEPAARRYGILFNLSRDQEKEVRIYVDEIRRVEKPGEDRFMRGYWG